MTDHIDTDDSGYDDLQLTALVFAGYGAVFVGLITSIGLFGWQIVQWLQSEVWTPMPIASFGIREVAEVLGNEALGAWAASPTSWLGLHRMLDWLNVAVAPIVLGMIVSRMLGIFASRRLLILDFHSGKLAQGRDD